MNGWLEPLNNNDINNSNDHMTIIRVMVWKNWSNRVSSFFTLLRLLVFTTIIWVVLLGLLDFPIKEKKSILMTQLAAGVIWHWTSPPVLKG